LWAAFGFGAGIFLGSHLWRPAVWWLIAGTYFIFAGIYYLRRRIWAASALGLCTLITVGAFSIQARPPANIGDLNIPQFTDGREMTLTAHVIKEGIARAESFGNTRRSVDLETEQIESDGTVFQTHAGIRIASTTRTAKIRRFTFGTVPGSASQQSYSPHITSATQELSTIVAISMTAELPLLDRPKLRASNRCPASAGTESNVIVPDFIAAS